MQTQETFESVVKKFKHHYVVSPEQSAALRNYLTEGYKLGGTSVAIALSISTDIVRGCIGSPGSPLREAFMRFLAATDVDFTAAKKRYAEAEAYAKAAMRQDAETPPAP